jgi:DNA-binding NarL/FixJ family response regulator
MAADRFYREIDMDDSALPEKEGHFTDPARVTRIMVVDDHAVVVEGIKSTINSLDGFVWAGEAGSGEQALRLVPEVNPDIIIMDISLGDGNGVDFSKIIRAEYPDIRIIVYSMYSDKEYVIELFKAQVSGYVLKQDSFAEFIIALQAVRAGGTYFNHVAPQFIADHLSGENDTGLNTLSRREFEIFRLLADGKTVKEAGMLLHISPKTVETHKYHIMAKLGLDSVTGLTKLAIRERIISI